MLTVGSASSRVYPGTGRSNNVRPGLSAEVRGHLRHSSKVLLHHSDLADVADILRGIQSASEDGFHGLAVLQPLLDQGLSGNARNLGRGHSLHIGFPVVWDLGVLNIGLALATFGRLLCGRRGRTTSASVVIVHALHVIPEVPLAGKSVARLGTLTPRVGAAEGLLTMSVPAVGLTLMAEEAGS